MQICKPICVLVSLKCSKSIYIGYNVTSILWFIGSAALWSLHFSGRLMDYHTYHLFWRRRSFLSKEVLVIMGVRILTHWNLTYLVQSYLAIQFRKLVAIDLVAEQLICPRKVVSWTDLDIWSLMHLQDFSQTLPSWYILDLVEFHWIWELLMVCYDLFCNVLVHSIFASTLHNSSRNVNAHCK